MAVTIPEGVALDAVGIFYVVFAFVWTCLLLACMLFLHRRRDMPLLRIRSMHFSFSAVILLHLYWVPVQLGYVIGALMPPAVEFWIMSIYLPFGIALFQASNSELLHVAKAQERFIQQRDVFSSPSKAKGGAVAAYLAKMKYPKRMLMYIGAAMSFQALMTVVLFTISRKFHSSWGIPGTEVTGTELEQRMKQGKGWEWWPSIFWQVFWAWIFAPVILWKARKISDTHGWRLQTMICCVAGLHACPLWLVALYVPEMAPVNKYFIPPQWVALSVMILEISTILLPCIQVLRHQSLQQETLQIIARWEAQNQERAKSDADDATSNSFWTALSLPSSSGSTSLTRYSSSDSLFVMGALETVLETNPEPLRQFSALHDFSGENIAFLVCVAEWKATLEAVAKWGGTGKFIPDGMKREMFRDALRIYAYFICPVRAEFPINIADAEWRRLESIFENAARVVYGTGVVLDLASPFEGPRSGMMLPSVAESDRPATEDGSEKRVESRTRSDSQVTLFRGEIDDAFDGAVFDEVERSIKYLVLTNTWPKFVRSRQGLSQMQRSLAS